MASLVELAPVPAMTGMRPADVLDVRLDQLAVLVEVDRRRFAGGADDDDAVRAFRDVPVDQTTQRVEVEPAVFGHRRNDGYQAASQHKVLPLVRVARA